MTTSAIGTSSTISSLSQTMGARRPAGPPPPAMPDPSQLLGGQSVDGVDLSDPGQLFQQLQELHDKDPEQLKQVLSDIADKLRAVAQGDDASPSSTASTSTREASAAGSQFLQKLADRFDAAAESGDLSSLVPPGPPPNASRAEQAYRSAEGAGAGRSLHGILHGGSSSDTSSADVQQQIDTLRAQIATLIGKQVTTTGS